MTTATAYCAPRLFLVTFMVYKYLVTRGSDTHRKGLVKSTASGPAKSSRMRQATLQRSTRAHPSSISILPNEIYSEHFSIKILVPERIAQASFAELLEGQQRSGSFFMLGG